MARIGVARVLIAIAALGCVASETPDEPARDPTRATMATVPAQPWYRRARALDLSGDGQADSVRLEALGVRPESLRITLTFVVDGTGRHRERWGSSYELALLDSTSRASPRVEVVLRDRLDSVLASVVVQPLTAPGVRLMKEDSAVLARFDPRPTHRVSFSYGYETTVRLVWDAPRKQFVRLWSCC